MSIISVLYSGSGHFRTDWSESEIWGLHRMLIMGRLVCFVCSFFSDAVLDMEAVEIALLVYFGVVLAIVLAPYFKKMYIRLKPDPDPFTERETTNMEATLLTQERVCAKLSTLTQMRRNYNCWVLSVYTFAARALWDRLPQPIKDDISEYTNAHGVCRPLPEPLKTRFVENMENINQFTDVDIRRMTDNPHQQEGIGIVLLHSLMQIIDADYKMFEKVPKDLDYLPRKCVVVANLLPSDPMRPDSAQQLDDFIRPFLNQGNVIGGLIASTERANNFMVRFNPILPLHFEGFTVCKPNTPQARVVLCDQYTGQCGDFTDWFSRRMLRGIVFVTE